MKILCLYNNECAIELFEWLKSCGHEITMCSNILNKDWCERNRFELTICYTYRYILPAEIITALGDNVVNIHNSFLPFNRGADPNIWSILDGTPRGVTLHYIDEEIDKGIIINQKIVLSDDKDTFKSSYYSLDKAAKELFKESFAYYKYWREMSKVALGQGNYHSSTDGKTIKEAIGSYETKISVFNRESNLRGKV